MEGTAITVRQAYKHYSGTQVLTGFNMTVRQGNIYGLLGASGCGKTTLLSCILGLQRLNSGTIHVAIDKLKDLGYMPQEIAIHEEFTVEEIFRFYGLIFGLDKEKVKKTTMQYTELFEIPSTKRLLSDLSGGQQRRVSLAVSLFHDPKLIILDEPTVGLDPILKEKVWNHLIHLSRDLGKTIVITTHYLQEAMSSNMVGLMRGGVLLEEEPPLALLSKLDCSTMDEAFLKVCLNKHEPNPFPPKSGNYQQVESPIKYDELFRWTRVKAQLLGNYIKVKRTWIVFFVLLLPIMHAITVRVFLSLKMDSKLGVYFEEMSRQQCSSLAASNFTKVFSCGFLDLLQERFLLVEYEDVESGLADTRANKTMGFIHVGPNSTASMLNRASLGLHTPDPDYDMSDIAIYHKQPLDFFEGRYLYGSLHQSYRDASIKLMKAHQMYSGLGHIPVKPIEVFFLDKEFTANSEIVAFNSGFVFYLAMLFSSCVIFEEKRSGFLARNTVTGLTKLEVMTAHIIIQSGVLLAQCFIIFIIVYYMFFYLQNGNPLLALMIYFIQGLVGTAAGLFWGELSSNYIVMSFFILGWAFFLLFFTGALWPMEGQWWLMRELSWIFPSAMGVNSLRAVILRGQNLFQSAVYVGIFADLAWILILAAAIVLVTRVKRFI